MKRSISALLVFIVTVGAVALDRRDIVTLVAGDKVESPFVGDPFSVSLSLSAGVLLLNTVNIGADFVFMRGPETFTISPVIDVIPLRRGSFVVPTIGLRYGLLDSFTVPELGRNFTFSGFTASLGILFLIGDFLGFNFYYNIP